VQYVTQQDLIDRFGEKELRELSDRVNRPPTMIDDTVVSRHIADAEALANGYIAKVYALPLTVVPPVLTKVCADLARYYLHGKAADKDSPVTAAYNQAISWLKDVARGLVELDAGGDTPAQAGTGAIKANPSGRVMRRDTLRDL